MIHFALSIVHGGSLHVDGVESFVSDKDCLYGTTQLDLHLIIYPPTNRRNDPVLLSLALCFCLDSFTSGYFAWGVFCLED
jgi:hypothetical protein